MNAQDITRETYDSTNKAQKVNVVAGSISSSGQATITPLQAWPDPKGYIGLVTVTGNFSTNGNVTLNPSQNWIGLATVTTSNPGSTGNVTLNPSNAWIGLATVVTANAQANTGNVTLNPSPNYIGLVSVSHSAWADPKTFIGLNTSVVGSLPSIYGKVATLGNTAGDGTGNWKYLLVDDDGHLQVETAGGLGLNVGTATIGIVRMGSIVTLAASPNYIGLTTSVIGNAPILGASTNYIGLVTVANINRTITGNLTLSDSKGFIGLTTAVNGQAWPDPKTYIGLVTVANSITVGNAMVTVTLGTKLDSTNDCVDIKSGATVTLNTSSAWIGLVTVSNGLAWTDPKTFIGLTTVVQGGGGTKYIGLVTVTHGGSVSLSPSASWIGLVTSINGAGTQFIGLVTAWSRNAGTTKTLIHQNIQMYGESIATIAVPSNTFKITQLLINSDATVRLNIKSGATYLTGNASIGINLNPNGGWVESGSPDSPVYVGLAGAAAIVVEKYETGVTAKIGGKLIYFDE